MLKVLIGAGHRNLQRGNEFEMELNGEKVRACLDLYDERGGVKDYGFELRNYTPDRGMGMSPLNLNQVPPTGFKPDWIPDLMAEFHSEGVGNPEVAGAFSIYPDWGDDVDNDIKRYGHLFPEELRRIIPGMGIRHVNGPGIMSEKRTGVGIEGYRLGVFRDTAVYADTTSRTIWEAGAHSNPRERALMERPDFPRRHAEAFLYACTQFFDATQPGWRKPKAPTYVASEMIGAVGGPRKWEEFVALAEPKRILDVDWAFEQKRMVALRAAVCRSGPGDEYGQTRRKLDAKGGEMVVQVMRGKAKDGVRWTCTKHGTCLRSSALRAV